MKKQLILLVMMMLPMVASAYDFVYSGVQYTIVSTAERTVEVAASTQSAGFDGTVTYSGDIVIPSTVIYGGLEYTVIGIGQSAFSCCTTINSVSLPSSLKYIEKEAFQLCVGLHTITLPRNIESIGYNVFWSTSITEITVLNPVPAKASNNAFLYPQNYNNCVLYVPYGSSQAYRNAEEWKKFGSIIEMDKEPDILDGHEYVDLGLPSGKCWAGTNYGSSTPEGYGTYLNWDDNSIISSKWGADWTTPSIEDIKELENNCTWEWSKKNGHDGYTVKGKNGNSIFLPASGYMMQGQSSAKKVGEWVYYWSSTKSGDMGKIMMCTSSNVWYGEMNATMTKLPIRPITKSMSSDIRGVVASSGDNSQEIIGIYDLQGHKLNDLGKGMNIIKMSNGTTKKVYVK